MRVCLAARALYYPYDGHLWSRLNWALGLIGAVCDVVWLEVVERDRSDAETAAGVEALQGVLERHGVELALAGTDPPDGVGSLEEAATADLLLSHNKRLPPDIVARFRRTALIDVDPGQTQLLLQTGLMSLPPYDLYYTIGEGAMGNVDGVRWHHVPQCVALDAWPLARPATEGAFTTVTHWWGGDDGKRAGFEPYFDLPALTRHPLEIALLLEEAAFDDWSTASKDEWRSLRRRGWRLRDSRTLWDPSAYRAYIQDSLGEFSCAKPSYVRLETAWFSDRTLCYLASGKPVVVEHTGPSKLLPDRGGMFRFRNLEEAARCLDAAVADYDEHARLARELAEEHFDATKVLARVLEMSI